MDSKRNSGIEVLYAVMFAHTVFHRVIFLSIDLQLTE